MFVYLIHCVINSDARYLFLLFHYCVKFEPQVMAYSHYTGTRTVRGTGLVQ